MFQNETKPRKTKKCPSLVNIFQRCTLGQRQFLATETPLKMIKNAFFHREHSSSSLNFCANILVMKENGLIRKLRLIS